MLSPFRPMAANWFSMLRGADGRSALWLRLMDSLQARQLPGTEGANLDPSLVARQPIDRLSGGRQSQEARYLGRNAADPGPLHQPRDWNLLEPRRRDSVRERRHDSPHPGFRRRGHPDHGVGLTARRSRRRPAILPAGRKAFLLLPPHGEQERRLCRLAGRQASTARTNAAAR